MMISCKKAAQLCCESLDRPLSLQEQFQLRFHLCMCAPCKAFHHQNKTMQRTFDERFRAVEDGDDLPRLDEDACQELKKRLRDAEEDRSSDSSS